MSIGQDYFYPTEEVQEGYLKILSSMTEEQVQTAMRYKEIPGSLPLPCPLSLEELDQVANYNVFGLTEEIFEWYKKNF